MKNYNLHTHTVYCGHGKDLPQDYAGKALEGGLSVLGFSEHLPFPDRRLSWSRMDMDDRPRYLSDIENAREMFGPKGLDILLGWECDYFEDQIPYYEELVENTDYLTFGCHFLKIDGEYVSMFQRGIGKKLIGLYADNLIEGMMSGFFDFVAHPDVFFFGYENFDDEARAVSKAIIECAKECGIPMEINGNGLTRKSHYDDRPVYPMRPFWELALELGADRFVANTDAHASANVAWPLKKVDEFAEPLGIKFLDLASTHPFRFRTER